MPSHKTFTCYLWPVISSFILVASSGLLCSRVYAADAGHPATYLDSFLNGLQTYSAAFEQEIYDDTGMLLEKSDGVFYMRRPGMFHWAYYDPYSQMLISDGVNLWVYDEDLDQVIIKNIAKQIGNSPAAILGGDVNINDLYVVIRMDSDDGLDWLELTPRDIDSEYKSIQLGFKGNQLLKMVLLDNLEQKNVISFLDAKRNPSLNLELFTFVPPEGVDVIDNRQ